MMCMGNFSVDVVLLVAESIKDAQSTQGLQQDSPPIVRVCLAASTGANQVDEAYRELRSN